MASDALNPPFVTVIVPVYNVEEYLAEAVGSLTAQTYRHLEILLIDDDSTDGSLALARRLAQEDPRITVVAVDHGGLGATRNRGLERARGDYVTFVDADDIVPPDAFSAMVASLEASGSAFVTGGVERFDSTRAWIARWVREVHGRDRRSTTLAELPEAMRDILACNRMYRRSFWDEHIGPFPEGMVYEDHVPMLRSYLNGTRFDVLAQVTYRWRKRDDGTSLSQPKDELANLADRARAKADAWDLLEREGTATEKALWIARVFDLDLVPYLNHAGTAEPDYQELLATTVATYLEHGSSTPEGRRELAARVRGPQRLAAWYAAHRDWTALASLAADLAGRRPPLARLDRSGLRAPRAVVDDRSRAAAVQPLPDWWAEVPLDVESSLMLNRLTWNSEGLVVRGTLKIPGLAVVPGDAAVTLTVGELPGEIRAHVVGPASRRPDAPHTGSELDVVAVISRATLATVRGTATPVRATLVLAGTHTEPVTFAAGTGTRAPRPRAEIIDGTAVLPVVADDELHLRTSRPAAIATMLAVTDGHLRVALSAESQPESVAFSGTEPYIPLAPDDGTWTVALDHLAHADHDAPLEAVVKTRGTRIVASTALRNSLPRGLAASVRGTLHIIPGPRARLTAVAAHDDGLDLGLVEAGLADVPHGSTWHAIVRDTDTERLLPVTGTAPTRAHLDVPHLAATADGHRPTVASVRLTLVGPDGTVVPLRVADAVLDAQPFTAPSGAYNVRVVARKDGIEMRVEHLKPVTLAH
ncbi:glycosyltransferase [Sanguibacter sp. A247]|uniref:glycosyltransferase n=1 Tax=unclassified Sanguibacter TaxID=2645534 RepID=UPI003FD6F8A7